MPTLYKILSYREKVILLGTFAFALISFVNFIQVGTLDSVIPTALGIASFLVLIFYFERKYRHRRKERRSSWKSNNSSQYRRKERRSSWKSNNSSQYKHTFQKLKNQQNKTEAELKAQYKHTLKKLQNQQNKKESEQKDEIKQMKSKFTELEKKLSSVTPKENEVKDIKENTFHNFPSRQDLNDNFSGIDPFQMEDIVGALFEKKGYSVEVTKRTNDFGIDVWATNENEKIGIQVKKWKGDVGYKDVSGTLGSSLGGGANKCIIISATSFFTKPALTWVKDIHYMIGLWDTNRFKEELVKNDVMTS